jgi:hypothetical protein
MNLDLKGFGKVLVPELRIGSGTVSLTAIYTVQIDVIAADMKSRSSLSRGSHASTQVFNKRQMMLGTT